MYSVSTLLFCSSLYEVVEAASLSFQPRTPATNTSKGVTIQEVFDDPQEYMNVGDFSNPNITFQQAEMVRVAAFIVIFTEDRS